MENLMLSLDEIGLLPSAKPTDIDTRSIVDPFIKDSRNVISENQMLPVFVAPMTSIVNKNNAAVYEKYGFIPIIPRTDSFEERLNISSTRWTAFSLEEFVNICENIDVSCYPHLYILVDIANGHIGKLYRYAKSIKEKYDNISLMVGNIAHPDMYVECCNAGIDYVRVGIGGGSVCSTSVQCGVHASHVWMIEEIKKLKKEIKGFKTKVIADGGINTFDRAIKCLALGYDYVMMGKMFARTNISCGELRTVIELDNEKKVYINKNILESDNINIYGDVKSAYIERKYYGMASEQGQIDISGGANKNPEGIETWVKIDFEMKEFREKFEAALRSTMSYLNAKTLFALPLKSAYAYMSINEFKSYYK